MPAFLPVKIRSQLLNIVREPLIYIRTDVSVRTIIMSAMVLSGFVGTNRSFMVVNEICGSLTVYQPYRGSYIPLTK